MPYDFEKELMRGIPADLASDFFIRIKGTVREPSLEEKWASLSSEEQDILLERAAEEGLIPKVANGMGPAPLPPTAKGQNMSAMPTPSLSPTGMGQNPVKLAAESKTPKERAHEQIEISHEKFRHSSGDGTGRHIGTLGGALAGGAAGHLAGGHGALGAVGGALAGRAIRRDSG